jgi:hypothetical protein
MYSVSLSCMWTGIGHPQSLNEAINSFESLLEDLEITTHNYNTQMCEKIIQCNEKSDFECRPSTGAAVVYRYYSAPDEYNLYSGSEKFMSGLETYIDRHSEINWDHIDTLLQATDNTVIQQRLSSILKQCPIVNQNMEVVSASKPASEPTQTASFSTIFHLKYASDSNTSHICFQSDKVYAFETMIPYKATIIVAENKLKNTAFMRVCYLGKVSESDANSFRPELIYEFMFLFNEDCNLSFTIIPPSIPNHSHDLLTDDATEKKFANDSQAGALLNYKTFGFSDKAKGDSSIQAHTKLSLSETTITLIQEFHTAFTAVTNNSILDTAKNFGSIEKFNAAQHNRAIFYLCSKFPATRYLKRVNRNQTKKMNGIIIDDELIKHKHKMVRDMTMIHYAYACMRAVAAVLIREHDASNSYSDPTVTTNWKTLIHFIDEYIEKLDPIGSANSIDRIAYNTAKLAALITHLHSNRPPVHAATAADLIKITCTDEPGYEPGLVDFGSFLLPFFIKQMHDVTLMNRVKYDALLPKQREHKKVVVRRSSGEKQWESTCKRWTSTHHVESYGRFFIDISKILSPSTYNLTKELPRHNNSAMSPESTTVSVPVDFKETYQLDLRVYHQDLHGVILPA